MRDLVGPIELNVTSKQIDNLYKNGHINIKLQQILPLNSYLLLRSFEDTQKTALAKLTASDRVQLLTFNKSFELSGIKPRDARQFFFSESLTDQTRLLSVGIGPAGTGKTTIAIAYALDKIFDTDMTLHMCKPTALVGSLKNTFGPVPGTTEEKYAPHIGHFSLILQDLLGEKSKSYLDILIEKKKIQFTPLEYARGMTFKNCVFVLDEVQNLTWHELKTICSRMGENSKLIMLGDPEQIDRKFSLRESGIYHMLNSAAFKQSDLTSSVYLTAQYRGPIAELITDIDNESREQSPPATDSK